MKKTTIDTSLLPKVYLHWATTKGTFYLDCAEGKKYTASEFCESHDLRDRNNYIYAASGSNVRYAYAKYHEDIERLELAEVTVDTTRKVQVHEWKYAGNKYFLGKDKSVVDENGNVCTAHFTLSQYHVDSTFKGFLGMYYRLQNKGTPVSEFKKFLGSDTYCVGSGRVVDVRHTWHIQEWYKTSQKPRGAGKEQKLVDKLTAIPLSDASWLAKKYPVKGIKEGRWYTRHIPGIVYFERLDDGWSVLRMFNRNNDGMNFRETERMYLHDDGTNRIATPSENGWCTAKAFDGYWSAYQFVNKDEAMQKCNRMKYIVPLIDCEDADMRKRLVTALRFPEVEQLIRLGYKDFALNIATSPTPRADMKNAFGYYNEKEKSLLRKVGMTKYQFDELMKAFNGRGIHAYATKAIKVMREFFDTDFIHLDNATFDKYFVAFESLCRMSWGEPFRNLKYIEGIDRKRFIKNAVRLGESENSIYGAINDTINMYNSLNVGTKPDIDWYFASRSDVVRAHDAIDALKRAQDAERRAMWDKKEAERLKREEERRKKIDENRKSYEYEEENYIIRLPKDGNEIVREGSLQHICIGGYVSRHSTGGTNLFFLRKKNDPDMPFYAIEMNNAKQIIQIHGFGNRWLGNNPEVIPTVIRWLRKNKIKCDDKILTCASTGYGATANYVPMPVV